MLALKNAIPRRHGPSRTPSAGRGVNHLTHSLGRRGCIAPPLSTIAVRRLRVLPARLSHLSDTARCCGCPARQVAYPIKCTVDKHLSHVVHRWRTCSRAWAIAGTLCVLPMPEPQLPTPGPGTGGGGATRRWSAQTSWRQQTGLEHDKAGWLWPPDRLQQYSEGGTCPTGRWQQTGVVSKVWLRAVRCQNDEIMRVHQLNSHALDQGHGAGEELLVSRLQAAGGAAGTSGDKTEHLMT